MSSIHFVGGEKGGVGKSVLSRLISQYFLDKSMPYRGLDADQSHATLSRYYQDYTQAISLDKFESTDLIMDLAVESDQQVLIDLPAQSERFLDHWLEENSVLEMANELSISIVYWFIVDDGRDSVKLLQRFLNKYAGILNVVVVKNGGRGADFSEIESLSGLAPNAAGTLNVTLTSLLNKNVQQIFLPALQAQTMRKIDKLNFSFWAAGNVKDNPAQRLSLMERQRTRVWLKKVYQLFDGVLLSLTHEVGEKNTDLV